MTALLTQSFLRSNPLSDLTARYKVAVRRHREFPNLVFVKYDQIESPMAEPIVQECRGLILDEADDWSVVSFPFRKFFNHGEGHAAPIDWASARVYEKLDGSLMTLYWYGGGWRVASNGLPDASGAVEGRAGTFADLFWDTFKEAGYAVPSERHRGLCYMFEMTTPYNRVVVQHARPRVTLIGCRDLEDGNYPELAPESPAAELGWECVRCFPLTSADACLSAAKQLRAIEAEGFVACDARFNRVKIKSPQYVALALMKESFSARRMLEVVKANETEEFLTYFPEMRPLYEQVRARWESVCAAVEAEYARLTAIPTQKEFAAQATKTRFSAALFALRAGKAESVRQYFTTCSQPALERVMLDGIEFTL